METIWLAGEWRLPEAVRAFRAEDPSTGQIIGPEFGVSGGADIARALEAAGLAATRLREVSSATIANFLEDYAARIEADAATLVALAHAETGLPNEPRLAKVELPRTVDQLRQAARCARQPDWTEPRIDTRANIRACFASLEKPVVIFGPNNFPLAFNAVAGSDFCSAIVARNPVIAKGHPSHPATTRRLAELMAAALAHAGLPLATVQVFAHIDEAAGLRLVADSRVGAVAFTGSRAGGLALKVAADQAGVPIYLELSSVNPVFVLPGALAERGDALVAEFAGSCLAGAGQFCTNPGVIVLVDDPASREFIAGLRAQFVGGAVAPLLNRGVLEHLEKHLDVLRLAGARALCGGARATTDGYRFTNTLLEVDGERFLREPRALQTEVFGPVTLIVVASDIEQAHRIAATIEPQLTACVYSARDGRDDPHYDAIANRLRARVGRLLNDKLPTGVAVSPAMNHGGPYPATGHPGFTAVGLPGAIRRFTQLQCYDNVREARLPGVLRDGNPDGVWRWVDGAWTRGAVGEG